MRAKEDIKEASLAVTRLEEKPEEVPSIPGPVYAYFDVVFAIKEPGRQGLGIIASSEIENVEIDFKVKKSWMESVGAAARAIRLQRYNPEAGEWGDLPTENVGEDPSYVYFSARSPGFSLFLISATPPGFTVSNISMEPSKVKPGASVSASALITNTGGSAGTYRVVLEVEKATRAKEVTLRGGESTTVKFTIIRQEPGSYRVKINGRQAGIFTVLIPARFELTYLEVAPETVKPGEDVRVSVGVRNTGELWGSETVLTRVDGEVLTREVSLGGERDTSLSFILRREEPGEYRVVADGFSDSFRVTREEVGKPPSPVEEIPPGRLPPERPEISPLFILISVVIAAALLVILVSLRHRLAKRRKPL